MSPRDDFKQQVAWADDLDHDGTLSSHKRSSNTMSALLALALARAL